MPLRPAVLAALLLLSAMVPAQLPPGTYTIDPALPPGGTNFQTWGAASAALASGVTGPGSLIFNVASVIFVESVTLPSISGTGPQTTITFVAAGLPAVIDANGQLDGLVLANAQSYLNFENIAIRGFTRYGLHLFGSVAGTITLRSTFCTFRRIIVDAPPTTSTTVNPLRNYYGWDCTFEDCRFLGGGYTGYSQQIARNYHRRCEFDGKGVAARLLAPYNTNDADNVWENCFFHDCGATGNGLHIDLSSYGNMFWHNTILVNTSGRGVLLGAMTAWARANSFRNNVVVNLGSGVCMTYGSAAGSPGLLECNDLDANVYYAPNGAVVEVQGAVLPFFTRGTLAAWRAWFAANPGIVPAGGGTDWDTNSIEADPGLASMSAPYDIHLATGSPCRDSGTSLYVAGPWISFNQTYVVADDFETDPRPPAGVDIGADEAPSCPAPEYETNGPASSLDIDGLQGSTCLPAISVLSQGIAGSLNFASTNVGLGWEAVLAFGPLLPASGGAFVTANGQMININFAAPAIVFLNGSAFPNFGNPFPGSFGLGFIAPTGPLSASVQLVNLDPGHPDFASVSQGCQLNVP